MGIVVGKVAIPTKFCSIAVGVPTLVSWVESARGWVTDIAYWVSDLS
jgi:hypothetical protein